MERSVIADFNIHSHPNPQGIALQSPDGSSVTYKQLSSNIKSIGDQLMDVGLERGDVLALVAPDGVSMVQSILGSISVCVCAPLNPAYSDEEFQKYFVALGAKAVLVDGLIETQARTAASAIQMPLIEMRTDDGVFSLSISSLPAVELHNGIRIAVDTALLLFSSGTTGLPKLIPLTHDNINVSAHNIAQTLQLNHLDRSLSVMPLFLIHGLVGSTHASLVSGGSVVCCKGFDAAEFCRLVRDYKPTWYSAVPTIHHAIEKFVLAQHEAVTGHSLRFIRSSSSPLSSALMAQLEQLFEVPVVEAFGMTEAAHQVASNPLPPGCRKAGSVGLATGAEVTIFDVSLRNQLCSGMTGEIAIRGASVTSGYLNDGVTIVGAYVGDWLLTGDLGYIDESGYVFITGRRKEMINRGGEKISPAEIDRVLLEHSDVVQAAAFGVSHDTLGEALVAAVVLKENTRISEAEIRSFVAERVALFKIPAKVFIVETIPTTDTGKPQRHLLTERYSGPSKHQLVISAEQLQTRLLSIWAEVLGKDDLCIDDNFFLLGGDSLHAAQVASRIASGLDTVVPLRWLFESPTVGELAQRIEAERTGDEEAVLSLVPLERLGPQSLSYAQERLWFLDQLEGASALYNMPFRLRLVGSVNAEALEQALQQIVERHEVFARGWSRQRTVRDNLSVPKTYPCRESC